MASSSTNSAPPPLLRLPVELHRDIIDHLKGDADNTTDDGSLALILLRLTNRHFYYLIPNTDHPTFLRLEHTAFVQEADLYTCKHCVRLRPGHEFAETMLNGKRTHGATESHKRFCADCGFTNTNEYEGYSRGTQALVGGVWWVWCIHCDQVKKGADAGPRKCHKACKSCFERFACVCRDACFKHKNENREATWQRELEEQRARDPWLALVERGLNMYRVPVRDDKRTKRERDDEDNADSDWCCASDSSY